MDEKRENGNCPLWESSKNGSSSPQLCIEDLVECIIKSSGHRCDEKRIKWFINWVGNNGELLKFLIDNLKDSKFNPFADPWTPKEIEYLLNNNNKKSSKVIRLSSRELGCLTISTSNGKNFRCPVKNGKIIFGKYVFKTVSDLADNLDNTLCCICLDIIKEQDSVLFSCRHLMHANCFKNKQLNNCPYCKETIGDKNFYCPKGDTSVYTPI